MKYILSIALIASSIFFVKGQSKEEQINRALFNKIEFFINSQKTDSVYNLAADNFKEAISGDKFAFTLQGFYQLGRIKDAQLLEFKDGKGIYLLEFPNNFIQLTLSVNDENKFDGLLLAPGKRPTVQVEKTVISQVEKISPLDFYIDSVANTYAKQQNTQSLAIGVFHNNSYKSYFYGATHKGGTTLPTENTIYEIGSITKVFTSVLLADLVTKNQIQLDDPIIKYLPDSLAGNPDLRKITFKELANHSAGLPRLPANLDKVPGFNMNDPYASYDRKALFSFLKSYKAKPEEIGQYAYSNLGTALLGELVAIISKKTYMQCVKDVILTPLQMTSTTDKPDAKNVNFIPVYNEKGEAVPAWNFLAMAPAGGLKSSLRDMMLFAVEQFKMPLNGLQNAMALTREFTMATPHNIDLGLAWHMSMADQGVYFWHNGGTGGSRSFIGLSPDTKTAIVALSNSAESVDEISIAILEKLMETKD
ncbi:serine hydrolase domain-containing protein [Sphingobacterium sp. MYb382]|uniref:serine hydrolase domain-containing protein n=1 Tax=Sphingobacterium sp. MYb382 TaxID=2745278 RepID=UPI0030B1437C